MSSCVAFIEILSLVFGIYIWNLKQVLCTVTLGAPAEAQRLESLVGPPTKRFMLHYSFPPFCINEVGKRVGLNRREVGHGKPIFVFILFYPLYIVFQCLNLGVQSTWLPFFSYQNTLTVASSFDVRNSFNTFSFSVQTD